MHSHNNITNNSHVDCFSLLNTIKVELLTERCFVPEEKQNMQINSLIIDDFVVNRVTLSLLGTLSSLIIDNGNCHTVLTLVQFYRHKKMANTNEKSKKHENA